MGDERTILPSATRLRKGWRAGVRPESRWLTAGVSVFAVGLVLGALPWARLSDFGVRWQAAVADPSAGTHAVLEAVGFAASAALALVAAAVFAVVLTGSLVGGVGPADLRARRTLGLGPSRGLSTLLALSVVGLLCVAWSLSPVTAGAARAVDASPGALVLLWSTWAGRAWSVIVMTLVGVGFFEWVLCAASVRQMLAQTPEQARDEARRRGHR